MADNERDLTRVVVEIIHDIRDGDEVEDALDGIIGGGSGSVDSDEVESQPGDALGNALGRMKLGKDKAKASDPATAEEEEEAAFAKAVADVRCLHILRALLERISGVSFFALRGLSPIPLTLLVRPRLSPHRRLTITLSFTASCLSSLSQPSGARRQSCVRAVSSASASSA